MNRLKNLILCMMVLTLVLGVSNLWSRPLTPEQIDQLKAEGRYDRVQALLEDARSRGLDQPAKIPPQGATGERGCVVLLLDYEDNQADWVNFPPEHFEQMLFSENDYPTGSLRDYYKEQSYALLNANGEVNGYYRMPQLYSWYTNGQYGTGNYPQNCQKMVEDAVVLADPDIDFSQFDNDGPDGLPNSGDDDGFVDGLFAVHAGPEGAGGNGWAIWSHKWQTSFPVPVDGVFVSTYSTEPAEDTIGVYCHEFGHVIGLPDLYDYDNSSSGVSEWCLMANGGSFQNGTHPGGFIDWCKVILGWVVPLEITNNIIGIDIPNLEENPFCLKLHTDQQYENEYILVSNRQKIGADAFLPGDGLLIAHCKDTGSNNNNEVCGCFDTPPPAGKYPKVQVEQADAMCDLEHGKLSDAGDPFPGVANNRFYNIVSNPNSRAHDYCALTYIAVDNISNSGPVMTADVSVYPEGPSLIKTDHQVEDLGNGDGYLDPGETINLYIELSNAGEDSTGISAVLGTNSFYVEVITNSANYPDIPTGESANSLTPYTIKINEKAPEQQNVPFVLQISAAGNYNRVQEFSLKLGGPQYDLKEIYSTVLCKSLTSDHHNRNIVVDKEGRIHVAFKSFHCTEMSYARSDDGGQTWFLKENIYPSGKSTLPTIALDSENNIHILFRDNSTSPERLLWMYSSDLGNTWSFPDFVDTYPEDPGVVVNSRYPTFAIGSDDTMYCVWASRCPADENWNSYIWYAMKPPDGDWSVAAKVSETIRGGIPMVSCGDGNIPNLVWTKEILGTTGTNEDLYYSKFVGGVWTEPENITGTSDTFTSCGVLAVDHNGACHVLFNEQTAAYNIYYTNNVAKTWSEPVNLGTILRADWYGMLSIDEYNHPHVTFTEFVNLCSTFFDGQAWQTKKQLTDTIFNSTHPDMPEYVNNMQPLLIYDENADQYGDNEIVSLMFIPLDDYAPDQTTNLQAEPGPDYGQVTLTWTSSGDDGNQGKACYYDLRYAVGPIEDEASFQAATFIPTWAPLASGSMETFVVSNLDPATLYYFALKTYDESSNASPISNNATSNPLPVKLSYFSAEPGNQSVLLNWRTESETNNLGFNLWRSDNLRTGFTKINESLIPGAGNSSVPTDYSYLDSGLENGRTYYYYLEDVTYSGQTHQSETINATPYSHLH